MPVLLNTSFNENEPIVERPEQALDCFLRTDMDVLVMGPHLLRKRQLMARAVACLFLQPLVLARHRGHRPTADRAGGRPGRAPRDGSDGHHRLSADRRSRFAANELRNGVRVLRASGTTLPPARFIGRAANYLTYFLSALWRGVRMPRQDVTVALTDPPIIGLAALAARSRHGMVFFCQDIFPEVAGLLEDFHSPLVNAALDRVNRLLVARAARVVALGDTMAQRLVEGKGADPARITVIHNWADTAAIVPSDKDNPFARAHGLQDRFVVLHAGNIGLSQNLDVVIERGRPPAPSAGTSSSCSSATATARRRSRRRWRRQGLDNVRFLPFQPRDQLRWTYATSDVCLVSLKPGLAGYIVPSKLYPILAAGRPYVAAVDASSEVAVLTERHGCGVRGHAGRCRRSGRTPRTAGRRPGGARDHGRAGRARPRLLFARDRQVAAARAASFRQVAGRT